MKIFKSKINGMLYTLYNSNCGDRFTGTILVADPYNHNTPPPRATALKEVKMKDYELVGMK